MKKNQLFILILAGVSMLFASCKTQQVANEDAFNGEYKVATINTQAVGTSEVEPFINFNWEEQNFNGNAGCNNFFAAFELSDENEIMLGHPGMTRKMCPNMETEDALMQALGQVKTYKTDCETITFYNADSKEVLKLERK